MKKTQLLNLNKLKGKKHKDVRSLEQRPMIMVECIKKGKVKK